MTAKRGVRAAAIALLLGFTTLGEGGATPTALLCVHLALALLLCLEILSVREAQGGFEIAPGPGAAFACFTLAALAGSFVAGYRFGAWLVVLEIGVFGGLAWAAARSSAPLRGALASVLPVFAAVQGLLAIVQALLFGEARPAGTFLNPNHLAAWLVAALCLAAAAPLDGSSTRRHLVQIALALPAAAALFLTASRGALLGIFAAAGALVALAAARPAPGSAPRRRVAWLAGAGAAVLVCALGIAWRFRTGEQLALQRTDIWRAALSASIDSPMRGTGPGQFRTAAANLNFPLEQGPLRYERYFESPHSDWLRLPAEFGWPAAIAFAAFVLLTARHWLRRRADGEDAPVAAVVALLALAAQATVDDLSERPAIYLLAAALFGTILAVPSRSAASIGRGARWVALACVACIFAAGDVAPWLSWRASHRLARGRLDAAGRDRLARAIDWNPLRPELWMRKAEDVAGDGSDWTPSGYAAAREHAEHAVRLDPSDASYRRGLARIEALACRTLFQDVDSRERAARAYEAAMARSLHDPFLPFELAGFLLQSGDPLGARRAAEAALRIEPQSVAARVLLAAALAESDLPADAERSQQILDEAQAVARRWQSFRRDTPYAKAVLDIDPKLESAVTKRLRSRERPVASGVASP